MRRRLVITFVMLCAATSALLLVAWARSYWRADVIDVRQRFSRGDDGVWVWRHLKLWSSMGGLIVRWERHAWHDATPAANAWRPVVGWRSFEPGRHYDHSPDDPFTPLSMFDFAHVENTNMVTADGAFSSPEKTDGVLEYKGEWLFVPHWFAATVFLLPAVLAAFRARRRRRRAAAGLCIACGYDLRATAERCPECGATVPQRPPSLTPVPPV